MPPVHDDTYDGRMSPTPIPDPLDGRSRCAWGDTQDEAYRRYHDTEWGVPVRDERHLFELLLLEGAQAGLSWSTILTSGTATGERSRTSTSRAWPPSATRTARGCSPMRRSCATARR